MTRQFDVIIVGAGMVGATLALALSEANQLNIALIESYRPKPLQIKDPYELRVSALSRSSEAILKNLGIWDNLIPERVSAFTDMRVWETETHNLHYDCAEMNAPWLGHIIENRHIQQACLQRCQQKHNIEIIAPASPVAYQPNRLELDNGLVLEAKLIVAADGAESQIRQWANINVRGWSYKQKGLVCTVTTEQSHQQTAWQRFLTEGPLAFLPLADNHKCSIVWSLNDDSADRLVGIDEQSFIEELNEAFQLTLGNITAIEQRAAFPLKLRHAETYIQPGLALVGDAAHTIHPLAGQGVNIGLLDAVTLSDVVIEATEKGRDIGSMHTLQKYQRKRRADNITMQMSMDAFKRVFTSQLPPIKWVRRLGLSAVNHSPFLKQFFIEQASSRQFAQPELSKTQFPS